MDAANEDFWNESENKPFSFDDDDADDIAVPETFGNNRLIADDNISEISFEIPSNVIPLHNLISEDDLKIIIDEQSLEEEPIKKKISIDEELKLLRRRIQDFTFPPPADVMASKLLVGKNYSLEPYRSLEEKKQLLDEVIKTGNGDAILKIIIFLVSTLNRKQMNKILLSRPEACNHYLNYLIIRMKIVEAADLLSMLGRDQEAAMLQFRIAANLSADPQMKKQRLKKVCNDYFSGSNTIPIYSQIVANYINLLEWQLSEKSVGGEVVLDSSPVQTLYYACSRHKWTDTNSNDPKSPFKFASDYNISAGLFEWTALNERAKTQAYLDIEALFEKSSWNIIRQKQFHINIPIEAVILRLYSMKAPTAVLNSFLNHLQDAHKKLALAKRVHASRSVIDALVSLKEKQELEEYRLSLIEGTEERFYAENSLKNLNKKWSTEGIKLGKN